MTAITIEQARALTHGKTLYMLTKKNKDGTPVRWRVSGKVQTWKTRPNEFKIPVKHGLYDNGYVTHENYTIFSLTEK